MASASSAASSAAAGADPINTLLAFAEAAVNDDAKCGAAQASLATWREELAPAVEAVREYLRALRVGERSIAERRRLYEGWTNARKRAAGRFFSWMPAEPPADAGAGAALAARLKEATESPGHMAFLTAAGEVNRAVSDLVGALGSGRSNRSKRAAKASTVLSSHAGLNSIPGAAVDRHGNALDDVGDLVADGAFEGTGTRVVILQLYTQSFDCSLPITALKRKGLVVDHFAPAGCELTSGSSPRARVMPSPEELDELLGTASQVWVISDMRAHLTEGHLAVIERHWRAGLGLYAMGDNAPFYVDANALLARLQLPTMSGNQHGDKHAKVLDEAAVAAAPSRGLDAERLARGDLATTGVVRLYEGITVATFDDDDLEHCGFKTLLRESGRGLAVTARRDPEGGAGPVVADGAFTRLFCSWDGAGSARFVTNIAAMLATDLGGSGAEEGAGAEAEGAEEDAVPTMAEAGGFEAECDVTFERGLAAIALAPMPDPTLLTSDIVLDNALGSGEAAAPFVLPQVYSVSTARALVESGSNPFTRQPLQLAVPAVSLSTDVNRKLVGELLCHGLLGGARMPNTAFMLFYAACQQRVLAGSDHKGVFAFFLAQIEEHITTRATFGDTGPYMALRDAMAYYLVSTSAEEQRKTFSFTAAAALTMARLGGGEGAVVLRTACRRALVRSLHAGLLQLGKASPEALNEALDGLLYSKIWHGIATRGSERAVTMEQLARVALPAPAVEPTLRAAERLAAALGGAPLLSDSQATALSVWARFRTRSWAAGAETALVQLVSTRAGKHVWNNSPADWRSAAELAGLVFLTEAEEAESGPVPGFATTLGPSVFRWNGDDGPWLIDPTSEDAGSDEWIAKAKAIRAAALRAEYHTQDPNGYPTAVLPRGHRIAAQSGPAEREVLNAASEAAEAGWSTAAAAAEGASSSGSGASGLAAAESALVELADLTGDETFAAAKPASAHCNLHRAVQRVMARPEHADATECTEAIERDVARYLLEDGKGGIHHACVPRAVPMLVRSLLEAKERDGAMLFTSSSVVSFDVRARAELARAAEQWKAESAGGAAPVMWKAP